MYCRQALLNSFIVYITDREVSDLNFSILIVLKEKAKGWTSNEEKD